MKHYYSVTVAYKQQQRATVFQLGCVKQGREKPAHLQQHTQSNKYQLGWKHKYFRWIQGPADCVPVQQLDSTTQQGKDKQAQSLLLLGLTVSRAEAKR